MSGTIHPLPQYAVIVWCLVKAQGQLYLFTFIKTSEREAGLSPLSRTDIKNSWRFTATVLFEFQAFVIRHRDRSTLTCDLTFDVSITVNLKKNSHCQDAVICI